MSNSTLNILRLNASASDFSDRLSRLVEWNAIADVDVESVVDDILGNVKLSGDVALLDYTEKFDRYSVATISELTVEKDEMLAALNHLKSDVREALEQSAERIHAFHLHQKQDSWQFVDGVGVTLGQQVTPLDRVGVYVPGGKASYPSSVLMNVIPARVAEVEQIIMMSPTPDGVINPAVLAAAAIAGVDRIYKIGGAQAIAALAYGSESITKVDKIVGPGNCFVACAKKKVFGDVGLDMVAGPSEILVICDGKTNPDWIAMDLFSQAEHDEDAQAILVCPDANYFTAVENSMNRLLPTLERSDIIKASINRRAAFIQVQDLTEAVFVSNLIAPEHLELSVDNPQQWLPQIRHAGAIFMGRFTPEALGDYCAGPNHVLPTSTTARFASPLGVYDFQKRSSIIQCSEEAAAEIAGFASVLARNESLTAHARSAEMRMCSVDEADE